MASTPASYAPQSYAQPMVPTPSSYATQAYSQPMAPTYSSPPPPQMSAPQPSVWSAPPSQPSYATTQSETIRQQLLNDSETLHRARRIAKETEQIAYDTLSELNLQRAKLDDGVQNLQLAESVKKKSGFFSSIMSSVPSFSLKKKSNAAYLPRDEEEEVDRVPTVGYNYEPKYSEGNRFIMQDHDLRLDEVKNVMKSNIDKVLARGESIECLMEKSADLSYQSHMFKRSSESLRRQHRTKFFFKLSLVAIPISLLFYYYFRPEIDISYLIKFALSLPLSLIQYSIPLLFIGAVIVLMIYVNHIPISYFFQDNTTDISQNYYQSVPSTKVNTMISTQLSFKDITGQTAPASKEVVGGWNWDDLKTDDIVVKHDIVKDVWRPQNYTKIQTLSIISTSNSVLSSLKRIKIVANRQSQLIYNPYHSKSHQELLSRFDNIKQYISSKQDDVLNIVDELFFISQALFNKSLIKDALLIISNVTEVSMPDVRYHRMIAYLLDEASKKFKNNKNYESLRRMCHLHYLYIYQNYKYQPQSIYDYASSLHSMENYLQATTTLCNVFEKDWDSQFDSIKYVALTDAMRESLFVSPLEPNIPSFIKQINNIPFHVDIRIVCMWDTDRTDVELHVVEPNQEVCSPFHNHTTFGGVMSKNFTQGFGPVEYMIKTAQYGKYGVHVKLFSSNLKEGETITAKIKIWKYFGDKENEEEEVIVVKISPKDTKKLLPVAELSISKN
eukprot:TRINITY_DN2959_c0_g2_i1.p1 TRINITY_DN2959_c0_g2~~TRINITY_DN2959_c0_g2_i1.p1  ORF type:complete len:849 (+),score=206.65 TRINITY_DN2959_c0_g2_i1:369-2549(+)